MVRDSRKIAAILAADVVDYSRLMGADEAGTLAALAIRRAIFDTLVREFDGRVFGSVGDSLMAEFPSAVNAVECAQAIQGAIANENAAVPPGAADAPAHRRQPRRRDRGAGRRRRRRGQRRRAAAGAREAGRRADLGHGLRPGAPQDPGALRRRRHAPRQEHRGAGADFRGAACGAARRRPRARRDFSRIASRRVLRVDRDRAAFSAVARARPVLARHAGADDRRDARRASAFLHFTARRPVRIAASLRLSSRSPRSHSSGATSPLPTTGRTLGEVVQPESGAPPGSIAVLPFINMTGDSADDYLGDGLAEELIHRLSGIPGLRVAARRSAFAYKGKDVDVRGIADALGVSYVVEGSVRRQGDLVRVHASLVDRATGANRWSNSYESSGDFFAIEDDIGTQVLAALELVLGINAAAASGAAATRRHRRLRPLPAGTVVPAQAEEPRERSTRRSSCSSARSRKTRISRARRRDSARRASSASCSSVRPRTSPRPKKPAPARRRSTPGIRSPRGRG